MVGWVCVGTKGGAQCKLGEASRWLVGGSIAAAGGAPEEESENRHQYSQQGLSITRAERVGEGAGGGGMGEKG